MRQYQNTVFIAVLLILLQAGQPVAGQLGFSINLPKPKEYDERVLRSEKSEDKKLTLPKRFIQNTVTHYNYFFNANNKLNEVLERAKESFKDDYSRLLSFYNYSLDVTARDSIQLDSVTYKSSTGIALHDLRSDWTDNLYLLWGAAFYLQKKFDSAYLMFQFINYAYAPKEKDGYYKTIGSKRDGNEAYSIATKEKGGLHRKLLSRPPSRNEAFIWQIRNFIAQDQFAEAASLIVTLKSDPAFPGRLNDDLHEVQAWWFYKQNMWDSAAIHLEAALNNATNKQEKARWEYLVAQLYELSKNNKEAARFYNKVSSHTTDPVLDIYARLYAIRVSKDGSEKNIEKNVDELLKMAKKDKYSDYQDIIYYMAAQMQLEANNTDAAIELLKKSTRVASNNLSQKNRAFLQLAELSYAKKQYRSAYNFYDSLNLADTAIKNADAITTLKRSLGVLAANLEIVERQDSLQRIAALPEEERKDFVRKLAKTLRRQQGLKDEPITTGAVQVPSNQPPPLFAGNQKGEWYFYNTSSRTRGEMDFKSRWGNRPNVDNWRRSATIVSSIRNQVPGQQQTGDKTGGTQQQGEISFESLYDKLPLTPQQKADSDDSLQNALFNVGKSYAQDIEDCNAATETFERIRSQFPEFQKMDEVLFNLYYCYNRNGETGKAAAIKKLMTEKHGKSNFTTIVATGKNPLAKNGNNEATKAYEKIYDLFIEGNFNQAVAEKTIADSLYGNSYWTPQLLYIEAVYYIRQRQDSTAKNVLSSIVSKFPNTPLATKATNLIEVLSRRAQIEEELKNLNVTRNTDGTVKPAPVTNVVNAPVKPATDSLKTQQPAVTVTNPAKPVTTPADSVKTKPVVPSAPYSNTPDAPHYVVLLLNKVDPVFCNEARNSFSRYNKETYYNKTYSADLFQLDNDNKLLMIAPFANAQEALAYIDKAKPKTATEILPWLKGGKYSFLILTNSNFDLLREKKDAEAYKSFLNQHYPGKF